MSTLKVQNLQNPNANTPAVVLDTNGNASFAGTMAMGSSFLRNRIINGDARVGQRGSTVFSSTNNLYGWCDRWLVSISGSTVSALGYRAGPGMDTTSGYAIQVGNVVTTGATLVGVSQRIESLNCFDLNSSEITVSGKVFQSTGSTQTLTLYLNKANSSDNFSSQTGISSTTISVPHNTWTPFTWTLTLGATDASNGIQFGMNYNSLSAQSNTQFYFGDIQLEKGSVKTPFETRQYGQELALCQRYYQIGEVDFRIYAPVNGPAGVVSYLTSPMRSTPTAAYTSAASASLNQVGTPTISALNASTNIRVAYTASATGDAYYVRAFSLSAEL